MNILEIEDVIKGLPDQALMQEAQAPSGQVPQFLVVSEIQRRADMRKRFQTQQQEAPQQTVAEQIVSQGIASMGQSPIPLTQQPPQGMPQQGMPQQGMQQPPMPPQGMPPQGMPQPPMSPPMSPPMMGQPPMQPQGMAAGGVVKMENGGDLPYTGGTQIDPGYEEFMRKQQQDYLLSQGRIRESMPAPEPSIMDRLLQGGKESGPNYNLIAPSVDKYAPSMGERFGSFVSGLKDKDYSLPTQEVLDALNRGMAPFGLGSPEGDSYSPTVSPPYTPLDVSSYDSFVSGLNDVTEDLLSPYISKGVAGFESLPIAVQKDAENVDPKKVDPETVKLGLAGVDPKDKMQQDLSKDSSLVAPDSKYDFSSALDILNQISPDYSALKPDYTAIITEQERRARKIQEDANKEASAQALIQLGAGLAAGDIASGISKAGQAVSDIRGRGRAEAREEEALARKMQLASDEAGMRLGLAEMEANRAIQLERAGLSAEQAKLQAKAERGAYEFEKTFGISLAEIESKLQISQNANYREALSGLIELRNSVDPYSEEGAAEIAKYDSQIRSIIKRIAPELAEKPTGAPKEDPLGIRG